LQIEEACCLRISQMLSKAHCETHLNAATHELGFGTNQCLIYDGWSTCVDSVHLSPPVTVNTVHKHDKLGTLFLVSLSLSFINMLCNWR